MNKRSIVKIPLLFFLAALLALSTTACSKKTGCKINDSVHTKTGKDGSFKAGKTKTHLFPKNMRKKKKK